jgi:hypothetical protein
VHTSVRQKRPIVLARRKAGQATVRVRGAQLGAAEEVDGRDGSGGCDGPVVVVVERGSRARSVAARKRE